MWVLTDRTDEESAKLIEELQKKMGSSKAKVIRKSLRYLDVSTDGETIPISTISAYIDFLAKGEHVIIDTEHWRSPLEEVGRGSEEFQEIITEIGAQHWEEYYDKGLREVEDILKYVEKGNWYDLSKDSENNFTLILRVKESSRFIKIFFDSLFKESPHDVKITEGFGKMRIKVL